MSGGSAISASGERPARPLASRPAAFTARIIAARRRLWIRLTKRAVRLGKGVQLSSQVAFVTFPGDRIVVGRASKIGRGAILSTNGGWIEIGESCSIQPYTVLYGHGGLRVGNHVRIATHTVVIPANHVFDDVDLPIAAQGETREGISIEDDVWIGANVSILDGVRIGRGSVIAAGSVVTRDIPPLSVAAGSPAGVVKQRGAVGTDPAA